jgi:hypothetical protein
MSTVIFIPLVDEGTSVWRPTRADDLGGGRYRILGSVPAEESWRFRPGEVVRCRKQLFSDGQDGLAAYEIA